MNSSQRADGATYQEIANAVGVSYGTVHAAAADVELIKTDKLLGADGKYRPATYARKPEPPPTMFDPGESAALELRQIRYMGARVIRYFVMGGPGIIQYFIAVALAPRSSLVYYYL